MSSLDCDLITLSRHVIHEQQQHKEASGDLTLLLVSIQVACKFISSQVRRAGLANLTGLAGGDESDAGVVVNVQGEKVKKLDILANNIFINCLKSSKKVSLLVSEENENEMIVTSSGSDADGPKYAVVFDPLDGSSNIESGVSIGSIFGIYSTHDSSSAGLGDVLRPGREMVAAGYAMYGSFTSLVLSTGQGAHGYTLDPNIGEFILTQPNITIPKRGKIYSVNEGNSIYWTQSCKKYFGILKGTDSSSSISSDEKTMPYSARYVGSMVADVHRTLLSGGIFAYPNDSKSKNGKLRLLYECFPMAFIVEQAGGKATTGSQRILDIVPTSIHQRSPIFLGSSKDVEAYEMIHRDFNGA